MTNETPNLDLIRNISIYVIDDSRDSLTGIEEALCQYQCKVKYFQDSDLAIETTFHKAPDIIITDIEMPTMTGLQIIKKIREQKEFSIIPILVMSSKDSPDQLVECLVNGADAFASKKAIQAVPLVNIFALMRVAQLRKDAIAAKQLEAVKNLIGTYKHEFGNIFTIIDGKINKLTKEFPQILETDTYASVKNAMARFITTLSKLNALREYKEENYSSE